MHNGNGSKQNGKKTSQKRVARKPRFLTAKAVTQIVERQLARASHPKKMSYPIGTSVFLSMTSVGLNWTEVSSSGVYSTPTLTRLTVCPQNASGSAAGQRLGTSTRI